MCTPVVKGQCLKYLQSAKIAVSSIKFVRMQEDYVEKPSSFHKSEASNGFFCGKDQMSVTVQFYRWGTFQMEENLIIIILY